MCVCVCVSSSTTTNNNNSNLITTATNNDNNNVESNLAIVSTVLKGSIFQRVGAAADKALVPLLTFALYVQNVTQD